MPATFRLNRAEFSGSSRIGGNAAWIVDGPFFKQSSAELTKNITEAFFRHWGKAIADIVPARLAEATPRRTGRLASSAYINVRSTYIEFGYRGPASHYWHLAGRGTWPAKHDQIIIEAALETVEAAGQLAIAEVLPPRR